MNEMKSNAGCPRPLYVAILSDFDGEEGISLGLMLMWMGMGGSAFFCCLQEEDSF